MPNTNMPGQIIGYGKRGPIRLQAGGSSPTEPPVNPPVPPADASPLNITVNNPPPGQQYFTAEQLEAARKQEKDKVYDRLKKAEDQAAEFQQELKRLSEAENAREAAAKQQREEADEVARKAAEAKLSAEELITKRAAEWDAEKEQFKKDMEAERAFMNKERQLFELQAYTQQVVAQAIANQQLAEDFVDYIGGNTKEEIDASLTKAIQKTANIVASMTGQTPVNPGQGRPTGVAPTGFGPSGPLDNLTGQRTYTAEQINAMSMEEFAAYRKQSGLDKAGQNKGLLN